MKVSLKHGDCSENRAIIQLSMNDDWVALLSWTISVVVQSEFSTES
jgi:hypothetical protein